ncbi:MAG: hypothetical protein ACK4FB_08345 [Brevundimonas sp.]|uniref:hypothetical protein n=1 Tax=Brevundimonas sp. TaxID=1871086 RepID=UPI003918785D
MMLRKTLIAAALTALAAPVTAQEADDFTARLNRLPGQTSLPAPGPTAQAEPAPDAPPAEDFTARLNRSPGAASPAPAPQSDGPPPSEPPILDTLSERLEQMRAGDDEATPAPEPVPPEPEPTSPPVPASEVEPEPERAQDPDAPPPVLEILGSQADLAFRVGVPEPFDLVERPSGPDFDMYQVSRGDTPFVSIYVGCCSLFPIYDGRQTEAGGRISILVPEGGANRAVEHLFVRESDGRQIHVWLHSVTGEDRAIAERIAQSVDPR